MQKYMGTSFIAKIRGVTPGAQRRIALTTLSTPGQAGWLTFATSQLPSVEFKFTYLSQVGGRFHYAITGAEFAGYYANAALGVSNRGYLGLYHLADIENVWKFDFANVSRGDGRFCLRDKDGHRVAVVETVVPVVGFTTPYLNIESGTLMEFMLEGVTLDDDGPEADK